MSVDIRHDATRHRFEATVDGELCTLDYELSSAVMVITHVRVPESVAGRGIAASLTEAALTIARASRWRVMPQCPYAAAYMKRHPAWNDLLADA
jgi:predicted GNAT family acetyltransferase